MGKTTASIQVATVNNTVCVKLIGRANFASSIDFKRLIKDQAAKGFDRFIVDLSECQIMDSTFLGMLAGLGLRMGEENAPPEKRPIELLNPTERVTDLLDNLGVTQLFNIVEGAEAGDVQFVDVATPANASKLDMSKNCLEAHQILMEVNPDNVARFKDVTRFFEEEVKKGEATGK